MLYGKVLKPGDTLTTRCTYSGPSRFGKGTSDERGYVFTTHWPGLSDQRRRGHHHPRAKQLPELTVWEA